MAIFNARTFVFEISDSFSLLVNTLTGAIEIVPRRISEGGIDSEERKILSVRGHLPQEDDSLKLEKLVKASREHGKHVPYWFYILTNLNCNFDCLICYERKILQKSQMSRETLQNVIGQIEKFQKERSIPSDRINMVIFGGEPLLVLNEEIIFWMLEAAQERGWKCVFVTNGSKVPRFLDTFDRFRDVISDFRITLDGPPQIHDSRRPLKGGGKTFEVVVSAIDILLKMGLQVKVQTIVGSGNIGYLEDMAVFIEEKGWPSFPNFQWRFEASHDYANLDSEKDEITEGRMVKSIIDLWDKHPLLRDKLKFESFKYLGHIAYAFGWLGKYKTYWGPKFGFCEPQKGFHCVFSTDGKIYHCPRTIDYEDFCFGDAISGFSQSKADLKRKAFNEKEKCRNCLLAPLCGGGCVVQKIHHPQMDCYAYVFSLISEFVELTKERILERAVPDQIVSVNELWF